MNLVLSIEQLFDDHGHHVHTGEGGLPVSARAHALQCAQRAEWADAEPALVVAALLHDVGHFIEPPPGTFSQGDDHELRAVWWLSGKLPPRVIEPIRLHVQAKRYLAAMDPAYLTRAPEVARLTLQAQGGPLSVAECRVFESLPGATQALSLRRWDDQAHEPGLRTPPLAYYLDVLETLVQQASAPARVAVAALDA